MSEVQKYNPEDEQPKDPGKRRFLKFLAVAAGTAATGGILGGEKIAENNRVSEIENGPRKQVLVKAGDTIYDYYEESGYKEKLFEDYEKVFYKINPNVKDGLKEGAKVLVPHKGE